jgi:hypothetical protein
MIIYTAVLRFIATTAIAVSLSTTVLAQASDANAPAHHVGGASATNPVAPILQLQIQNFFVPESFNASGYANQFIIQPVLPYEIFDQPFISRLTLPVVTTPNPYGPIGGTTGLGDTTTINFAMWDITNDFWAGDLGFGPPLVMNGG